MSNMVFVAVLGFLVVRDNELLAAPTVEITTDPAGARVVLNGQDQGNAPTTVVVPEGDGPHKLCVHKGDINACRELTIGS